MHIQNVFNGYDGAKNWTSLGLTTFEAENENNNIFQDNPISEINSENYLETPNNQYLVWVVNW